MRLIDADALLAEYDRQHEGEPGKARKLIEDAPTVDAVEVVSCRECKYHNKPPCPMRLSFNWTEDDDFCSYGERKDGDGNG